MSLFSSRTDWPSSSNPISQQLQLFQEQGTSIIDLTCSNPTRCGFSYPFAAILQAFQNEENLSYQPDARGMLRAREAVCRYYAERGVQVSPQNIFLTASTSEAYSLLFRLLVDHGEEVVFPKPSYPLFEFLAGLNDIEWKTYPLVYDGSWRLDRQRFREVLSPLCKTVIIVNPNNPTGSCLDQGEVSFIENLCSAEDRAIICDEVFLDYPLDPGSSIRSLASDSECLTFVLGGLSKAVGLPQMKLSWIVVSGPASKVEEANRRLEMICDTYLSVNTPAQNALSFWLRESEGLRQEILGRLRKNYSVLTSLDPCGVTRLRAQGGWYAVLALPPGICEEEFSLSLLKEEKVYTHPGYFFDFESEPFLVVSLLPPENDFRSGMDAIGRHVERVQ